MRFDAIFFDIGNTLFFYNYEFLSGFLAERFDVQLGPIQLAESHRAAQRELIEQGVLQKSHEEIWFATYRRWLANAGLDERMVEEVVAGIRKHPFNHLFWTRVDDGVPEMLDWFKERGFKMGVISNAEGQIKRLLEHAGLDFKFDAIVDSGDLGITKPDAGIFRYALDAVGASAETSIHVGDLYDIDVLGARGAGMTPVLVETTCPAAGDCDCLTVRRAADLPNLDLFKGL
jgi:HAD superfamily hydrolase (TIGR01549 family)